MTRKARLSRPSGDLQADRRFLWAEAAEADGDFAAAADLYAQASELAPAWPPAWYHLGKARLAAGDAQGACEALKRYLALEPGDMLGAAVLLAEGEDAPQLSDEYIRALFDAYAGYFDEQLKGPLRYRGPEMIMAALDQAAGNARVFQHALDLGCGTGLMGKALGSRARRLSGVDLSPEMLKRAAALNIYEELEAAELGGFLRRAGPQAFDLVIAADVFVYMPDLADVFAGAARALQSGGIFAFSAQCGKGAEPVLGRDKRYWHPQGYLEKLAAANTFEVLGFTDVSTRVDNGEPVPGLISVLRKQAQR